MLRRRWSNYLLYLGGLATGSLALFPLGCSRYDYVRDADEQAYKLIAQKSDDPRWAQSDFAVELDPRSRYFDPYDDVSPPMPPDDPAASKYMHRVDGKKHWAYWDQFGFRPELENPGWEYDLAEYVEMTPEGKVRLGLEEAVRLAIIHKPEYQEQFETVYLSALDVSTERFRFDTQFFGSLVPTYTNLGPESGNVVTNPTAPVRSGAASSSRWDIDSGLTARRRLSTAGELLVGFANSTVFELVGRNANISTSVLNFSFIQPLLRAGGRAFALEQLTIVERALLSNLRALERYRQGFFTDLAVGSEGVQGPRRRGGFFGGTGLTGFTGQGSGGFGGVGRATGFGGDFGGGAGGTGGGAGTTGFAGGGAGSVGGYFGLLQRVQQIRNSEQSLELQLNTLNLLEEALAGGLIDIAQVDQFRQSIETERATLLQARIGFQDAVENYLVQSLGLPPDVPVELKEDLIEPFQFTSEESLELQASLTDILVKFGEVMGQPTTEFLRQSLEATAEVFRQTERLVELTREDLKKMEEQAETRKRGMTDAEKKLYDADIQKLKDDLTSVVADLQRTAASLASLLETLDTTPPLDVSTSFVSLIKDAQNYIGELSLIQARSRLEIITVEEVSLTPEKAIEIARAYRLDWMNNRANLVDTWRLIEFNANALKSNVSLRVDGDISTLGGDNPFKFRDETGTVRASLLIDPPFTRLVERNNFRQQLIEYQQSRRQLIQYEDGVYLTLRATLRNLEQLKTNLEIQRRAVAIAIRRVEETRLNLNRPVPPPLPGTPPGQAGGGGFGPTAALNLLTALSDLRNTQNNFLSVWLNYYASRMVLMRELGLMRIDENGMWIDEPLDLALAAALELSCEPLPPEVPENYLETLDDPNAIPMLPDDPKPSAVEPVLPDPDTKPREDEQPRLLPPDRSASRLRKKAGNLPVPAAWDRPEPTARRNVNTPLTEPEELPLSAGWQSPVSE